MRRALPLLLLASACSLRSQNGAPCTSTAQCTSASVCFLGECRPHSAALTLVSAEVRPANDSVLGVSQVTGIDLRLSALRDFRLVPPVSVSGAVSQEQNAGVASVAVPGALVTFTDHVQAIPDRQQQISAKTDTSGNYTARLPQGSWDVLIQPPAPLPPYRTLSTAATSLTYTLPRVGALVQLQSALNSSAGPLAGAEVTAVDPSGNALSTPAETQADGGFSLYLPPGTVSYGLQVGPSPSLDGGVLDPLPNYDQLPPTTPSVDVDLPAAAVLHGVVRDSSGAPVSGALVYARSDAMPWSLLRSTIAAGDGSYSLKLRAGSYLVEAAPVASTNAPGVSGEQPVVLPASGATLDLTCPPKVRGYGLIRKPDGSAAGANYQITATRLADHLLTSRSAATLPTDSGGVWHITADPGRYRVEVLPTADSGLPRKVVQLELEVPSDNLEIALPEIGISPPLSVVGTVRGAPPGASDLPVANATVSFYALDSSGHSVLLGSAPTDSQGRYETILPDVAQPGVAASR